MNETDRPVADDELESSVAPRGRVTWSRVKAAMGVVLGLFTISGGIGFFLQRGPAFVFSETATPVFDVREPIETLEVRYGGEDLRQARQSLTVVQLTVANPGNESIRRDSYDERDLPGVEVSDARIIRASTEGRASSSYLAQYAGVLVSGQSVRVVPVILDPDEFFTIRLLLLHPDNRRPLLSPIGKVANVRHIGLVGLRGPSDTFAGFLAKAFEGGLAIQASRAIGYFLAVLLIVAGVMWIAIETSDSRIDRRRRRLVAAFTQSSPQRAARMRPWLSIYSQSRMRAAGAISLIGHAAARESGPMLPLEPGLAEQLSSLGLTHLLQDGMLVRSHALSFVEDVRVLAEEVFDVRLGGYAHRALQRLGSTSQKQSPAVE